MPWLRLWRYARKVNRMSGPQSITVTIYGHDYTLKGDAEATYVQKVASLVDQKMKEIAENSGLVSTSNISILAAVNLADELLRERQKHQQALVALEERSDQIASFLDKEIEQL
jgi:cell division protein ZapA